MEEKEKVWNCESFLVCDKTITSTDAPFVRWLRSEGFSYGKANYHYGFFRNTCWVYVNITKKLFIFGMPGIPLMDYTGGHAITAREFQTIYKTLTGIYGKYEGKEVFVFDKERFDCEDFREN